MDADGDGFPSTQDCDDAQAGINAGAQEVIADRADQDCDHQDTINRRLMVTSFPTPSWVANGSVTHSGLTTLLPNGTVHRIMNVDNLTGSCTAKFTTRKGGNSTVASKTISSTGTYVSGALSAQTALGVFPARTLSKIELSCTAGNSMT
ncbi:MAG: hypothetical protein EXR69_05820, partial [Myxococcales bacterium]|nr:hypothetical protein [Myxococcales bacterium]